MDRLGVAMGTTCWTTSATGGAASGCTATSGAAGVASVPCCEGVAGVGRRGGGALGLIASDVTPLLGGTWRRRVVSEGRRTDGGCLGRTVSDSGCGELEVAVELGQEGAEIWGGMESESERERGDERK